MMFKALKRGDEAGNVRPPKRDGWHPGRRILKKNQWVPLVERSRVYNPEHNVPGIPGHSGPVSCHARGEFPRVCMTGCGDVSRPGNFNG